MYTVYLFAVIGVYIGLVNSWMGGFREVMLAQFKGAYFGVLSGALLAMSVSSVVPRNEVVYRESALVRSVNFKGFVGSMLYGTDNIGKGPTYRFSLLDGGRDHVGEVPADSRVLIIEDSLLTNVGYWRTIVKQPDRGSFLFNWALFAYGSDNLEVQEFRVPVGSVVRNFGMK